MDKRSTSSLTDLFIDEKGIGFNKEGEEKKSTKQLFNEAS